MKLSAGKHLAPKWTPPRLQGPPSTPQVYAFAFHAYRDGITDHDWSEDIKLAIARGHFEPASPDTITMAIRRVSRRVGRKDVDVSRPAREPEPRGHYLSTSDAKAILRTIEDRYHAQHQHQATEPDARR